MLCPRILAVSLSLLLASSTTASAHPVIHVTPLEYQRVLAVHHCEERSWTVNGPIYKGGLGWRPATWVTFRLPWFPLTMNKATILEQAYAMVRFANRYGWPDLNGVCHGY